MKLISKEKVDVICNIKDQKNTFINKELNKVINTFYVVFLQFVLYVCGSLYSNLRGTVCKNETFILKSRDKQQMTKMGPS